MKRKRFMQLLHVLVAVISRLQQVERTKLTKDDCNSRFMTNVSVNLIMQVIYLNLCGNFSFDWEPERLLVYVTTIVCLYGYVMDEKHFA